MSSLPIKAALKHAAAWGIVVGFVSLLTIIFSFLGTLFCAALGGMMMGASKAHKALAFGFSVLCPGVLLGTLRTQKTELVQRQVLILAILCFAAFWALYFIAMFLAVYEKRSDATESSEADRSPSKALESLATANSHSALPVLRLDELEGKWCREGPPPNGHAQKRILEIRDGTLALSTVDAQGRVYSCAQGRLALLDATGAHGMVLGSDAELAAGI